MAAVSTEMRDTARLVNGRVLLDRKVIMARAWKAARREVVGYGECRADMFPLVRCFAESLRGAWADARAMVAWKLSLAPVAPCTTLALQLASINAAERPAASELWRPAVPQRRLATVPVAA